MQCSESSTHSSLQLQVTKVVKTITLRTYHPMMVTDNLLVEPRTATRTPTPVSVTTPTESETEPVKDADPCVILAVLSPPSTCLSDSLTSCFKEAHITDFDLTSIAEKLTISTSYLHHLGWCNDVMIQMA